MINKLPPDLMSSLNLEKVSLLKELTENFSPLQLAWVSGYFWGMVDKQNSSKNPVSNLENVEYKTPVITIISASQTGNARCIAEKIRDNLQMEQFNVNLISSCDFKFKRIAQEKILLLVISTYGEGEPPEEALDMYSFLMSNKAPKLNETSFAVFGVGDSSYEFFSKAGKDFDFRLAELGGNRLLERVDADVDYANFSDWCNQLINVLKVQFMSNSISSVSFLKSVSVAKKKISSNFCSYSRNFPFSGTCLVNQKITGCNSGKDVHHIEIDISNSGFKYQPGDLLGVWYENNQNLVSEFFDLLSLNSDQNIELGGSFISLEEAMRKFFELTVNTPKVIERYAELSRNSTLLKMKGKKDKLQEYAKKVPIINMIRYSSPPKLSANELIKFLRPLTPRFYSISCSQYENETEVHITVGAVRYKVDGYVHKGGSSSFLVDSLKENERVRIFIKENNGFRLPKNPKLPIIMICAGTGIAPFRSFIQHRDNIKESGKNWLFFGNRQFSEDFLYQIEWQKYVKNGVLTNIDLAWSRDQKNKVYIQDRIHLKSKEIWSWIKQGAHIYVCGDKRMGKQVEMALLDVLVENSKMDYRNADEFLNELRMSNRYQKDLY